MKRLFALTLVAAGGAALFGCKNTVSLNTGGSTATSTHATVTGTTGTQATNTTGGLVGSSTATGGMSQCQALCNIDSQLSMQLNCAPQGATCVQNCETLYSMAPQCSSQLDAVISCGQQQASPSTCMCDPQSGNSLSCPNICQQEANALEMCLKPGTSTGTGMTAVASSSNGGGGG